MEQLVDVSQTRAIGDLVRYGLRRGYFDGENSLGQVLDLLLADIASSGLDIIAPYAEEDRREGRPGSHPGDYALPRRFEIAAMLNRMRSLTVRVTAPVKPGFGRPIQSPSVPCADEAQEKNLINYGTILLYAKRADLHG